MSALAYQEFLKRFGITSLGASTSNLVPGAIIEKRKHGYYAIGHVRDIMQGDWATSLQPS